MKPGRTGTGGRKLCKGQEDHSGMGMDISETGNIETKGETRGTGTNGKVSEMCQRCVRNRNGLLGWMV